MNHGQHFQEKLRGHVTRSGVECGTRIINTHQYTNLLRAASTRFFKSCDPSMMPRFVKLGMQA
jgi:hypothetical protein